jgi:hypothetical protein
MPYCYPLDGSCSARARVRTLVLDVIISRSGSKVPTSSQPTIYSQLYIMFRLSTNALRAPRSTAFVSLGQRNKSVVDSVKETASAVRPSSPILLPCS